MPIRMFVCSLGFAICCPSIGGAQPAQTANLTPEFFATLAWGHLFRFGDRTFGDRPNIGGGLGLRHRSGLGIEFELNRTLGLSPTLAPCGLTVPCAGTGHEGVRAATIASANVLYHFSKSRIQPYLTVGIGALWSKGVSTTTLAGETQAIQTEQEWRDTGLALNWGGGVRILITRAISLRSEYRFYNSTLRSRVNLSLIRASIGVGYHW